MIHKLCNGTITKDPRLDRLVSFDERNRNFPIRALLEAASIAEGKHATFRSYTWSVPISLDQGSEGACVGFGWSHELAARPVKVPLITNDLARQIYWEAQETDEWAGGSYPGAVPIYEGTSVLAGAKVVKTRGYISEYRWAFGLNDLRLTLGYAGPAVLGLNWREGMMRPEGDGRIVPSGSIIGGHCILAYAVSERLRTVRLWNSWGADWWAGGSSCYVTFDDLATLLADEGEACVPLGRKFVP